MQDEQPLPRVQITGNQNIVGNDNISVVIHPRSQQEELENHLARAVGAFETHIYQDATLGASRTIAQPYKFLYSFGPEDAGQFFGRDEASETLHRTVLQERLTVLHARSGAGKTSLIHAGLTPRLVRESRLPVYVSSYQDVRLAIKRAIVPSSLGPWPERLHSLPLREFLGMVCSRLSRRTQELVILLDQFEEFFTFWPEHRHRQPFIDELTDGYRDSTLPIRFLISLRGDYLSELADLQPGMSTIFYNQFRLEPMQRHEAEAAIVEPARALSGVTYEQPLLEKLLDDLEQGGMELPHLQIVCARCFSALPEGETEITLASYERLGGIEGILKSYLQDTLQKLPGGYRHIAREALKELVSSEETKRTLGLNTLRARIKIDLDELGEVLERLIEERLLYRKEGEQEAEYELAHTYLAEAIRPWIDDDGLAAKRAQDLLKRELSSWRIYATWAGPERLAALREHPRAVTEDAESQAFLLQSALSEGQDVEFWLGYAQAHDAAIGAIKMDSLVKHLVKEKSVRRRVAQQLKSEAALPLRQALTRAMWRAFETEQGQAKRRAAAALLPFRTALPHQAQRLQVFRILAPIWGMWGLSALVLIAVLGFSGVRVWPYLTRERAIPGRWVPIPEGPFEMGYDRDEAERAERICLEYSTRPGTCSDVASLLKWSERRENARLPAFQIMDNEVTNAQFKQCVDAAHCAAPAGEWEVSGPAANQPVTMVNWSEATAYCAWLGGRLATEEEWEKAARGPDSKVFPWDDQWADNAANLERGTKGEVQSVKRYAQTDQSDHKIKNLAGNVMEWTASQYVAFPLTPFENDVLWADDIDDDTSIVVKGGAWGTVRSMGMASNRYLARAQAVWRYKQIGFRCVCPPGQECRAPWSIVWILAGDY